MTKKIFKSIGLIALAIAVAIGSFFVPIRKKEASITYGADVTSSSITFQGSDIYVPVKRGIVDQDKILDYLLIRIGFSIDSLNQTLTVSFDGSSGFFTQNQYNYSGSVFNFNVINPSSYSYNLSSIPFASIFNTSSSNLYNQLVGYYTNNTNFSLYIEGSVNPINSDIVSCRLGSQKGFDTFYPDAFANFIRYDDINGNYLIFYFATLDVGADGFLEDRTYYFPSALDLNDNQYYNFGYADGLLDNQSNIYNNGYNSGFDDGYQDGYDVGVIESNDYSFFSLFGAIFDAPVTLFTSLLNFNFLGINLWSFITSLLTLAIILFVVKLFIRR